ncbi:MAG: ABC transporter ATP-binding protein [Chloroflexi bacterium]|nr:ABC transporter ATP-binding protein [Chloroflexota bacterium]
MITITNLTRTYKGGITALDDIDLTIQPSGMFGLLGENGAGKSTLMRILAGILKPSSGQVDVFGHNLSTAPGRQAVQSMLGYLPQHLGLYPNLTGAEFLDYMAILKGINQTDVRRREVARVLDLVRLSDEADRRLKDYSGGMQRRIGIAQSLLGTPRLIIVDEPTTGLDPEERVRFRNLLSEIARDAAVILSTHIVEDIGYSCTDMAVLHRGRIIFRGAPAELIEEAAGQVWKVTGQAPNNGATVVSTLHQASGVQYRIIGQPEMETATPVQPTLEDGYMCLMRRVG